VDDYPYIDTDSIWNALYEGANRFQRSLTEVAMLLRDAGLDPVAVSSPRVKELGETAWASDDRVTQLHRSIAVSVICASSTTKDEREATLISGLTVVGGYGWAPVPGTEVNLRVCVTKLVVSSPHSGKNVVPISRHRRVDIGPAERDEQIEIPYERLIGFEFKGGVTRTGGGFFGGGFGLAGAVEGILAARVLNDLTAKTKVNSLVRISASDGELYVHHGAVPPEELRSLFAPAVNAVEARGAVRASSASDLTALLAKLADLHGSGALTDDEFQQAKAALLRDHS
jgi:hypothetical protein